MDLLKEARGLCLPASEPLLSHTPRLEYPLLSFLTF